MNLQEIFNQIESRRFEVGMGVFSGFRSFYSALQTNELVNELIHEIEDSLEKKETLYRRFVDLLRANDQPEYAHPHDAALAAYLLALKLTEPGLGLAAAAQAKTTFQLWWARKLAEQIVTELHPSSSYSEIQFGKLRLIQMKTKSSNESLSITARFPTRTRRDFHLASDSSKSSSFLGVTKSKIS